MWLPWKIFAAMAMTPLTLACRGPTSDPSATAAPESRPKPSATSSAFASTTPSAIASDAAPPSGPCPVGTLRVDGVPMKVKSARAYGFAAIPHDAFVLTLSSKDVDCPKLLTGARSVAKDEDYVDVGWGVDATPQQYVTSQNEQGKTTTELVKKPAKAGDPIEICVRTPVTLHTTMVKTSTIEISGLMKGTYCGELP